ncbi:hypothetical protein, partial [Mesorhizobium sp. M1A.T.Ca.IN.004.03.1.1]|uniref:hypothetical protein n=1 Tax=Mesorhizobium sp. M1A.T.Ca.IN.004.03.1.1 TaxID=2496795 RepID=UPI0019D034C9
NRVLLQRYVRRKMKISQVEEAGTETDEITGDKYLSLIGSPMPMSTFSSRPSRLYLLQSVDYFHGPGCCYRAYGVFVA